MSGKDVNFERVVIAVDPHKASWTAAVVNSSLQPLATLRVPVSTEGYQQLRRFASRWPQAGWAIEGAGGLGAPLAICLCADGIAVVDVPAKLAARVRLLSRGHGRKNDDADATSVGIAALTATGLHTMAIDETAIALRALVEHRDDLVKTRTQTLDQLHGLVTQLIPAGAPTRLGAETAAQLLRTVCARTPMLQTLRAVASDLITEIRRLDRRITATTTEITAAVHASGSTLTQLHGIANLLAGKILARVGDISRFRSAAAFITQIRHDTPGRAYYQRKRSAGKSHREALRCLKRQLSDAVYRRLVRDAHPDSEMGPGGHQGGRLQNPARPAQPQPPTLRTSYSPDPPAATLPTESRSS